MKSLSEEAEASHDIELALHLLEERVKENDVNPSLWYDYAALLLRSSSQLQQDGSGEGQQQQRTQAEAVLKKALALHSYHPQR